MMTIKEFLSNINGIDTETRKPKSAITIRLETINLITKKPTVLKSFSVQKPVVDVKQRGDYMELNFLFNDDKDVNMRQIWNILEEYGRLMNLLQPDAKNIPQLLIMIVPVKDKGKKFLYAYNPVTWYPKPKAPGLKNTILSILQQVNNMKFINEFNIDTKDIEAEAQREIMQEDELKARDYEQG